LTPGGWQESRKLLPNRFFLGKSIFSFGMSANVRLLGKVSVKTAKASPNGFFSAQRFSVG
jgi:hypothetical protein